ncbi:hypothetical protein E2C01_013427 [Portunus trituberculatus]|uniref:Uncharacterized protein n=1 Tax=Portunus trituberculatus TaxID=210409 RepID=A0A5B7DG69_PORTR|nr:hypothetical protein [Portunus trituberculatus]
MDGEAQDTSTSASGSDGSAAASQVLQKNLFVLLVKPFEGCRPPRSEMKERETLANTNLT